MSDQDYEYKGLLARSWDLLRGDTSTWPDRFLFRDVIEESGQPVLDVGCGTGRLLLDYLADGISIDGVDNSPEMLDICRQKASGLGLEPTLFLQQMEHLDLPRKYRTIIVPSSSFQLVVDPESTRQAMSRFYAHLEPGGTLAMPFMIIWQISDPTTVEWHKVGERVRPEDGLLVRRWSRTTYDPAKRLEHTEDRYELVRDGEVIASEDHSRSPATRWYTQAEAAALYRGAGFRDIRILHEFSWKPVSPEDTVFTVLGKKA